MAILQHVLAVLIAVRWQGVLVAGYSLDDPSASHDAIARQYASEGNMKQAVESFHAACKFSDVAASCVSLGVALMRTGDYGRAYAAVTEGLRRQPKDQHAKSNMKVLIENAEKQGISKAALKQLGEKADLSFGRSDRYTQKEASSDRGSDKRDFTWDVHKGASDMDGAGSEPRILTSAVDIAKRGHELIQRGEKRLGRGFLSLALHIDPWVGTRLPNWFAQALAVEEMKPWSGNVFIGYDKSMLEHQIKRFAGKPADEAREAGIYIWRGLQVTGFSCCGFSNFLVFLSHTRPWGHEYIIPFMDLVPEMTADKLNQNTQQMIAGYRQHWEENGRRPMPKPPIKYLGKQKWEWSQMNVVLPPDRVVAGWDELVQAVLAYRLNFVEAARVCALHALRINDELLSVIDEFLPDLTSITAPHPGTVISQVPQQKYVMCYNPPVGLGNQAVSMVSCHLLAKLTGRTMLLDWNVNHVIRHAYRIKESAKTFELADGAMQSGVRHGSHRHIYFFHMMDGTSLGEQVELFGCSDILMELERYSVVSISSNLYFAPILAVNPHVPKGAVPTYPELLAGLLEPSPKAIKRAVAYANKTMWGQHAPVIAVHIRAREAGEDNDDWPAADSPKAALIDKLVKCLEIAVAQELQKPSKFDVFIAATTEKAVRVVGEALKKKAKGIRNVLQLPHLERSRRSGAGSVDAMAEALLISRADVFVRLVVGTAGYSNFAYLSNALRSQGEWASFLPKPRPGSETYAPNYVVTDECGAGRCYKAPAEPRVSNINWYGPKIVERSCGNPILKAANRKPGDSADWDCTGLQAVKLKEKAEL